MKKIPFIKKQLNVSVLAFVMGLSVTSSAYANHSTYLGADAVYGSTKFKKDYGANIFSKKPAPGLNLFVGHMFNENFGAELGFEVYKKMKRTENQINEGTIVAGFAVPIGMKWESYKTTLVQRHPYFGAIIKTNITDNNSVSLLVGASLSHIKAQYTIFNDGSGVHTVNGDTTRTFSKTKLIPIIRATLEHKFNKQFGVRTILSWKNTSAFKLKSQERPSSATLIKAKDTFNIGIGATYYI
ncbi:MAG: outer membrane beta-barrel protein [Gammaproteobacteria bacterium]